jgi:hypothetical protein
LELFFGRVFFGEGSGEGQVEAVGGLDGGTDESLGFGSAGAGEVHAGELEAVEQGGGALGVEFPGGEGIDDEREGQLDGVAVFERGEFEERAAVEVGVVC